MRMTQALRDLYKEYDAIQGDNPIEFGDFDCKISQRQYKGEESALIFL